MTTIQEIDQQMTALVGARMDIDAEIARLEALKSANTDALRALVLERESITDATTSIPLGAWKLIVAKTDRVDKRALIKAHPRLKAVFVAVGQKIVARDADAVALDAGLSAEGIKMATTEDPSILDKIEDVTKTTMTFRVMEVKN